MQRKSWVVLSSSPSLFTLSLPTLTSSDSLRILYAPRSPTWSWLSIGSLVSVPKIHRKQPVDPRLSRLYTSRIGLGSVVKNRTNATSQTRATITTTDPSSTRLVTSTSSRIPPLSAVVSEDEARFISFLCLFPSRLALRGRGIVLLVIDSS